MMSHLLNVKTGPYGLWDTHEALCNGVGHILMRLLTRRGRGNEFVIRVIPLVVLISEYHNHQTLLVHFGKRFDTFTIS